ncbi:MAG: FHA domain-containing protein [Oscillatoriales cyanobacterium C42_A2020_001]|nr:FHA domain-containing protein [Leptolyngbyaceae cyanobacterium C42_A2020_001]
MIVCPNCNHQNPDGAVQCEACYTPLPATTSCPNCGATVQTDASFCGQCGFNLKAASIPAVSIGSPPPPVREASALGQMDSLVIPEPNPEIPAPMPVPHPSEPIPNLVVDEVVDELDSLPDAPVQPAAIVEELDSFPDAPLESAVPAQTAHPTPSSTEGRTQLQQQNARLLHVQTNTSVELPPGLAIIHIGKPNDRIPPDIDVSGFPNSEIVSRIHADIRLEGDAYYIEDVGSSNGTYINNLPLAMGNRHRLRPGDRVALGKGDKVTFLFQLS